MNPFTKNSLIISEIFLPLAKLHSGYSLISNKEFIHHPAHQLQLQVMVCCTHTHTHTHTHTYTHLHTPVCTMATAKHKRYLGI